MKKVLAFPLLAGGLLAPLLTGCFRPPLPPDPPVQLTFSLPSGAIPETPPSPTAPTANNLRIAALYYDVGADGKPVLKALGSNYYNNYNYGIYSNTVSVYLAPSDLKTLTNSKCTAPFVGGETEGMTEVTVTPDTVQTCNIYFSVFEDTNKDGVPNGIEEKYMTHDMYSYASTDFTYSMNHKNEDGSTSNESGTRRNGWSLVRHTVLQPSATPGKYLVTMNSVPATDEGIAIRMHEPTKFMTSMSLPVTGQGGQP